MTEQPEGRERKAFRYVANGKNFWAAGRLYKKYDDSGAWDEWGKPVGFLPDMMVSFDKAGS